jgi:hypothetical protein
MVGIATICKGLRGLKKNTDVLVDMLDMGEIRLQVFITSGY